jgi:hypothetical protein
MVLQLVLMYVMFLGCMLCRWPEIMSTYDLPHNYGLQVKKRFIDVMCQMGAGMSMSKIGPTIILGVVEVCQILRRLAALETPWIKL